MTSVHRKGVMGIRKFLKVGFMTVVLACVIGVISPIQVSARSTTKKVTLDLNGDYATVKRPGGLDKARKVVVKSSKKSVDKVKYSKKKGDRRVTITGKKVGKTTITVKCYYKKKKTKTYKYKITVVRKHRKTALEKGKEAFKIQNQYRKAKGVSELQWSDEIYKFCLYRMKTSGFDAHKNLGRDTINYFGNFAGYESLLLSENMVSSGTSAMDAMKSWKNSEGHYRNLLAKRHVCGAIATYKGMWFAIFWDKDKNSLENWKSSKLKSVTVKRYDKATGKAITGSSLGYYEVGNKNNTLKTVAVSNTEGKKIYLEIGKTYMIYEKIRPRGYEKAKSVTITVTKDGPSEVGMDSLPSSSQ